jgi:hypothetical protein
MHNNDRPFETIEDTQEFLSVLSDKIAEVVADARREFKLHRFELQQAQAWQVVIYSATKLSSHIANSRKIMSDLSTLRTALHVTPGAEHTPSAAATVNPAMLYPGAPAVESRGTAG